jgi:hypothetical protein
VCSVAESGHIKTLTFLATHLVYFTTEFQTVFNSNMNDFRRTTNVNPLNSKHRFSGMGLEYTKPFLHLGGHFAAIVGMHSCRHRWSNTTATQHFSSSPSYGISCL